MRAASWLVALSLVVLLGACKEQAAATEVLVVINADLGLAAKLDTVQVKLYNPDSAREPDSYPISVATEDAALAQLSLPLSFSLSREPGVRRFRLVVTGQRKGVDIIEQTAVGRFVEGARSFLLIYLDDLCEGVLCRDADTLQTCVVEDIPMCKDVPDRTLPNAGPGDLGGYDGGKPDQPRRDGGTDDGGRDADASSVDVPDASDGGPDASDSGLDAAPDAGPDAGPDATLDAGFDAGPCGTWVPSHKDASAPPTAVSYGKEFNDVGEAGVWNQFVCRVPVGNTFLPGKGVYGYSCYYVTLDNQYAYSDRFDVLDGTYDCARMTAVREVDSAKLLPTGSTPNGPLYSCIDKRESVKAEPTPQTATSYPLGRYDLANDRCVYEWYGQIQFSTVDGDGKPTYSVLTR